MNLDFLGADVLDCVGQGAAGGDARPFFDDSTPLVDACGVCFDCVWLGATAEPETCPLDDASGK